MRFAKNIFKAIVDSWFLWLIGGLLTVWGFYANGWIRIGFGLLFIYLGITTAINDYKLDRRIEKWLADNEGKLIFFYPTKKKIQEKIKKDILPLFDTQILQAYYDGPKIVGDLENINILLKRIMFSNPKIRPNNPSIIKIQNREFEVKDELKILMELDKEERIDKENLKKRISEACG